MGCREITPSEAEVFHQALLAGGKDLVYFLYQIPLHQCLDNLLIKGFVCFLSQTSSRSPSCPAPAHVFIC